MADLANLEALHGADTEEDRSHTDDEGNENDAGEDEGGNEGGDDEDADEVDGVGRLVSRSSVPVACCRSWCLPEPVPRNTPKEQGTYV